MIPLPFKKDSDGLTDLYRRIIPGSDLHNVICQYMLTRGLTYVALSVPSSRPTFFNTSNTPKFSDRFPKEYVDDLDSLLAQDNRVLSINRKTKEAEMIKVYSEKTYNEALLSMFVQSVQQINPTSQLLYLMVGLKPRFGRGRFVSSETNQCCFKNLVLKLKVTSRGSFDIRVFVREHVNHTDLLVLSSLSKWMNCEPATTAYTS